MWNRHEFKTEIIQITLFLRSDYYASWLKYKETKLNQCIEQYGVCLNSENVEWDEYKFKMISEFNP